MKVVSLYQWLSRKQTEKNPSSSCDGEISLLRKRISELELDLAHARSAVKYHMAHISALQDALVTRNKEIDTLRARMTGSLCLEEAARLAEHKGSQS